MTDIFSLALANLASPAVLFFALGLFAGLARSDLAIPEQVAKGLSIYLLLSIGFKGGAAAHANGLNADFLAALGVGLVLSVVMPLVAFLILRALAGKLERVTLAGVAAHYGSISIVTFVAAMDFAKLAGFEPGDYLAAVAAAMETPGIIVALMLAGKPAAAPTAAEPHKSGFSGDLLREVLLNGSVVVLVGAFVIGLITGEAGAKRLDIFVNGLFAGVLCLFLLEMGLVAARRMQGKNRLTPGLVAAGVLIPLVGAGLGLLGAWLAGLPAADGAIIMTLAASASYIAAPAAIRIALPEADPGVYLPLAIGVTFPFNIAIGIPVYAGLAQAVL
jgi:uncharacterized protein